MQQASCVEWVRNGRTRRPRWKRERRVRRRTAAGRLAMVPWFLYEHDGRETAVLSAPGQALIAAVS